METGQHSSELGRWRTARRSADPRLCAFVHGYLASSSQLPSAVRERHLPALEVPLLLNFGAPHRRWDAAAPGGWSSRDGAWVVGPHSRPQLTRAEGERQFMVVRFTPIGAHLFLGLPMHRIANEAVDLERIDPSLARALMSRVGRANGWAERFDAVEALIAERVAGAEVPMVLRSAWCRLLASDGRIALAPLAAELDCSHRTLIARFRTCIGFPPKTVARLLRFNRAVRSLDRRAVGEPYIEAQHAADRPVGAIPWADLAADCGYSDQAHLIRDFREFSGSTPAAFLRDVSLLG